MKFLKYFLWILFLLVVIYLAGPRIAKPDLNASLPKITIAGEALEKMISDKEALIPNIKPENASRIVWLDSSKTETEYVLLYLHGFSASGMEGSPIHFDIAKKYGANLYLPRLAGHGLISEDVFLDLTPEELVTSASEALAIAHRLGKKVIIMSCSTGSTLALYLAAHYSDIHGLICYAPNIDIAAKGSNMLLGPWGLQMARKMFNGKHREFEASDEMKKYWTNRYRLEGLLAMKSLVNATMTDKTFAAVNQPLFVGYYYKNEEEKDDIISIPRIHDMFATIGTPETDKTKVAFAEAQSHVINCDLTSKEIENVFNETDAFCREVLKMQPFVTEGEPN